MAKKPIWIEPEVFRPYSYIVDHIAKKDHTCKRCRKTITKGTKYYEKKIMTPSYLFFSEKYCGDCFNKSYNKKKETKMKLIKIPAKAKPFAYIYERKARKPHSCNYCGNTIDVGENYFHKKAMSVDRKFVEYRYCDPCYSKENI